MMRKKALIVVVALGATAVVAFPYAARFLSRPNGLVSLADAERKMSFMSHAIRAYRADHGGNVPNSYTEFMRCLEDQPGYGEIRRQIEDGSFQFHAASGSQDPALVSCYLPYRHGKTLYWIDRQGTVYRSRVWLWPTWAKGGSKINQ